MRKVTRRVYVGGVPVGGGAPVTVQTMLADDPHDFQAISSHLLKCAESGADIVRLTVPDVDAADVLGKVARSSPIPVVADIHYDYRCALAAIEAGAHALRLNPGNIGGKSNVQAVARAAKEKGIPIRIGVNGGSLEKGETLVSSALKHVKLLEEEGFCDIVISVKASNVADTLCAYRELAERTDYPLHLGLTEAGTFARGTVHSSVALGILLSEGIGDTIRVSLTDTPEKEVAVGLEILRALGLRPSGPSVTSCPTCGRTRCDVKSVAEAIEAGLEKLYLETRKTSFKFPRIAVMGCVVNGPGEAKGADIALCGGDGVFILYENGGITGRISQIDAVEAVLSIVRRRIEKHKMCNL
ncbi:MAG: flavodoxin-dependent (E)-4-hydroxy-3-methylbut-2-enyl-diphosphate synthase [Kiritimatiellae bacterium]|nr:flavodoxin-dependent (E)-4-hydroxy-3-methylbut-2-enyl-diphosphate synthase [Kiritimatiellia bacterium]